MNLTRLVSTRARSVEGETHFSSKARSVSVDHLYLHLVDRTLVLMASLMERRVRMFSSML